MFNEEPLLQLSLSSRSNTTWKTQNYTTTSGGTWTKNL